MATLPAIDDPPMTAGVQDLDAETAKRMKLVEEAAKPDGDMRAEFFGNNGDSICHCGYRRPSTQNLCQCGKALGTPLDGGHTPLLAINGPSDVVENQLEYDLRQSAFEEVGHRWVRWNCDQLGCELQVGCTVVPVLETDDETTGISTTQG
jgi:hypothetical protein